MTAREKESIASFLDAYNAATGGCYVVSSVPETVNRTTPEVDAIASCDGQPDLAIEHTTLVTHRDQRAVWQRFGEHIAPLEVELSGVFPFCFDLIVPDSALAVRKTRTVVASEIRKAFLEMAGEMPPGRITVPIRSAGADVVIRKRESDLHKVFTVRQAPCGEVLDLIAEGMHRALDHAQGKFAAYRKAGAITVALLESYDVGLINEDIVTAAVAQALSSKARPYVDQVWFAWILGDECEIFCLHGPADVRAAANDRMYAIIREY